MKTKTQPIIDTKGPPIRSSNLTS